MDTRDGAHNLTLRLIVMTDALGTFGGFDFVNLLPHGDRAIGALRLANVAVNTFVGNEKCHVDAASTSRVVLFRAELFFCHP